MAGAVVAVAAEVAALVEHAVQAVAETRSARVEVRLAAGVPQVAVDAEQIHQVLRNLLDNALDAAGASGVVRVEVTARDGEVELLVADSGPGVDPAIRARLFEPLITTKPSGVGLGLALCRKLVAAHGGTIELVSARELPGAHFSIRLPEAS